MPMLPLTSQASAPAAPPLASEPSVRPKMRRTTLATIGSATKAKIRRSGSEKLPSGAAGRCFALGAGRCSPWMRAINASIPASSPPAKSPVLKRGVITSRTIWRAARSGTAPSSALAGVIHSFRSFLATTINRPSPTSRRPTFQVSPTRWA